MFRYWATGFFILVGSLLSLRAQDSEFSYDLQPGDHLIYRYVFTRTIDNASALEELDLTGRPLFESLKAEERVEWLTHLLVLRTTNEGLRVGIQRNLVDAKLLRYERAGKDMLLEQEQTFRTRLEARRVFAEANILSVSGRARLPWVTVREWTSKLLYEFHEVLPLPPGAVHPGYSWSTGGLRNMEFKALGQRTIGQEPCLEVEGNATSQRVADPYSLRISYSYCLGNQLIQELEGGIVYSGLSFEENRESVQMQLVEQRRGENPADWLKDPALREAVLEAFLLPGARLEAEMIYPLIASDMPARVQRRALAVLYQRRLPVPLDRVRALVDSPNPGVRRLAQRLSVPATNASGASPSTSSPHRDSELQGEGGAFSPVASPTDPRNSLFSAPALAACEIPPKWSEARPAPRLGTFFTQMHSSGVEGWPMGVRIPPEYRGDEAFPVIINLAGNGGTAIEGILGSAGGLENTDYIVIYPHAGDFWWKEKPMMVINRVFTEISRRFNVDPNRVYLTGWSNGGTATFHFAAHWPQNLAAAVPIMGAGFWAPDLDLQQDVVPENVGNLPLLFLHGEKDRTIPVRDARETVRQLFWRRAPVEEHYFPNLGHEIAAGSQDEGRTVAFFERFTRNPFPRSIRVGMHHLKYPRHYWVELLAGEAALPGIDGTFYLEGDIGDDNTIRIKARNIRSFRLLLRPELLPKPGPIRVLINQKVVFSGEVQHDCRLLQETLETYADPYLAYSAGLTFELSWSQAHETHSGATQIH